MEKCETKCLFFSEVLFNKRQSELESDMSDI